jgi:hypothetical protein
MAEFVTSGRIVDIVLLVTLVEAVALLWLRRIAAPAIAAMLAPGLCLMLALRAALTGAGWGWIAALLVLAGLTHLADLRQRLGQEVWK